MDKEGSDIPQKSGNATVQEREWTQTALTEFEKGNYGASLQALNRLESSRPHDFKVMLNKAVVEYYKSDLKKTEIFRKNMGNVCSQANVKLEEKDSLEDVDHCVIFYNQAVILYHLRQYRRALSMLTKIFSFIEPLEHLAVRVCLLMVELHLAIQQPDKALIIINYVETNLQGAAITAKNLTLDGKDSKPSEKDKDGRQKDSDMFPDSYRARIQQYKVRCYLMMHSFKLCKREMKSLMTVTGINTASVYLKSNLEYLRGNLKKAQKLFCSTNHGLSYRDLGEIFPMYFYNNLGCIQHYLGKPNISSLYFVKAMEENRNADNCFSKAEKDPLSTRPLHCVGGSRHYELLYNVGICQLHAGKPHKAFDCLLEAVQVFHRNPRLWLRIAECCIMVHKMENKSKVPPTETGAQLIQGAVGTGWHRKLILSTGISNNSSYRYDGHSAAMPIPTLEFASLCLKNAYHLLPDESAPSHPDTDQEPPPSPPEYFTVSPSSPIQPNEVASLRCSALLASSYVSLCLGDYTMALRHAENLLTEPKLSGAQRFLGKMYKAEALVMLDKINDAISQLVPSNINDISQVFPGTEKDSERDATSDRKSLLCAWQPSTVHAARVVMQFNLAIIYTFRGEYNKANELLSQVGVPALVKLKEPITDVLPHIQLLALYIQLQLGNTTEGKSIIRRYYPQFR